MIILARLLILFLVISLNYINQINLKISHNKKIYEYVFFESKYIKRRIKKLIQLIISQKWNK